MLFLDPFFDVRESRLSKFAQIKGPSYHHSSFKQTQGGSPFVSHLFQDKPFQGKPPFTYSVNKIDQPFQLPTPLRGKNLIAPPTWFSRAFVCCCPFQARKLNFYFLHAKSSLEAILPDHLFCAHTQAIFLVVQQWPSVNRRILLRAPRASIQQVAVATTKDHYQFTGAFQRCNRSVDRKDEREPRRSMLKSSRLAISKKF